MYDILIVEDEAPIANLIRMSLTQAGYRCTIASDGDEGAVFVRQIVERDLVIRAQSLPEKFSQLHIVLQERVGDVRHMHTSFQSFVLWNLYHYI